MCLGSYLSRSEKEREVAGVDGYSKTEGLVKSARDEEESISELSK